MTELTPDIFALTLLSGAIVGLFLALFGGGGSVLAAPLLLYIVGVAEPHIAIGTSAAAVALTALVSLLGHWRGGRVKWPCAIVFGGAGLLGSVFGSSLAKTIDGQALLLAFAIAMLAIGLSMMRRTGNVGDAGVTITKALMLRLVPLGLVVGFAAGFFGIGGGFLIVPGLMAATGMTMAAATASSLVSVVIFGATTSSNYALSGFVDWPLTALLVLGGALGGGLGLLIAKRLTEHALLAKRLFAGLVIAVAIFVGWNAVDALFLAT
jgi:uncharacterized membrane protein YfcA